MEHLVTFRCDAEPKDQLQRLQERAALEVTYAQGSIGWVMRGNGDIEVWATKRAIRELGDQ